MLSSIYIVKVSVKHFPGINEMNVLYIVYDYCIILCRLCILRAKFISKNDLIMLTNSTCGFQSFRSV